MKALVLALATLAAAPAKPVAKPVADAGHADAGVAAPAKSATLTQVWTDASQRGPILGLAFSPDGAQVALGTGDKMVRVYDTATGKKQQELKGINSAVSALAFSPDGKVLAVGEVSLAVHLFRVDTGKDERAFPHPDAVSGVAFSPDGKLLAVSGVGSSGDLYTVADGKRGFEYQGRNAAFSADGKWLATAVPAGAIRVFDVATGKQKGEVKTAPHQPWLSASKDLKVVVSWNPADKVLHLWDAAALKPLGELNGHEKGVYSASLTADGAHAASVSEDRTLRLWDVAARQLVGHAPVEQMAFVALSSDGQKLALSQGNRLTLYQVAW